MAPVSCTGCPQRALKTQNFQPHAGPRGLSLGGWDLNLQARQVLSAMPKSYSRRILSLVTSDQPRSPDNGDRRQDSHRGRDTSQYRLIKGRDICDSVAFGPQPRAKVQHSVHVLRMCVYNASILQTTWVIYPDLFFLIYSNFQCYYNQLIDFTIHYPLIDDI